MATLRSGMSEVITKLRTMIGDDFISISMSGNEGAAQTVIELASTTGLKTGDLIVLEDSASSEQRTITSLIVDTSITVDAITNAYTTANSAKVTRGDPVFTDVELQVILDVRRVHIDYELLEVDVDFINMWSTNIYMDTDSVLRDGPSDADTLITASGADVFDFMTGRFVFESTQTQEPYLKGYKYLLELATADAYREMAEHPDKLVKFSKSEKGDVILDQKDCYDVAQTWENKYHKSLGVVSAGNEGRYD